MIIILIAIIILALIAWGAYVSYLDSQSPQHKCCHSWVLDREVTFRTGIVRHHICSKCGKTNTVDLEHYS